jgi:hypothetical protein
MWGDLLRTLGVEAQRTAVAGEMNYAVLDFFSLLHGLVGVGLAALGFGLLPTVILAVGWEVAERLLKDLVPFFFVHPTQDTLGNAGGDLLVALAGWSLMKSAKASWRLGIPGEA